MLSGLIKEPGKDFSLRLKGYTARPSQSTGEKNLKNSCKSGSARNVKEGA